MSCDPRDREGLAQHQLANAMFQAGDLTRAEAAYTKAIAAREALVKAGIQSVEITNNLAGSYKTRAALYLARFEQSRNQGQMHAMQSMDHLQRADRDVSVAVSIRQQLFNAEPTIQIAHDFAMTLYLRADIRGKFDQKSACNDLEIAIGILEGLVGEIASYRSDLACCRADLVLYSIPLTQPDDCKALMDLTERANQELADAMGSNVTLRIKYLDFLSNAATPAAALIAGDHSKAVVYINLGLDGLAQWADTCDPGFARRSLMFFQNIPAPMLPNLAKAGLNLGRYYETLARLMASIGKTEKQAIIAAKTIGLQAGEHYTRRGEPREAAAVEYWTGAI